MGEAKRRKASGNMWITVGRARRWGPDQRRRPGPGQAPGVKDSHAWAVLFLPRRVPGTGRGR
jgi:hypothetical protein